MSLQYADIEVRDPEMKFLITAHERFLDPRVVHTNLQPKLCVCAAKPDPRRPVIADGPPCIACGDLTFRAGSCYLCHTCGSTTGCG